MFLITIGCEFMLPVDGSWHMFFEEILVLTFWPSHQIYENFMKKGQKKKNSARVTNFLILFINYNPHVSEKSIRQLPNTSWKSNCKFLKFSIF